MTLPTMLLYIGIAAVIFSAFVGFGLKKEKSWLMTFFQSFCGILFLFSGWVKAVDPLGTAYKMEQYFDEFTNLFDGSWLSFLSPVFPFLSEYSIGFSVFMIIFEIILGLMILFGIKPKLSAWLFLILVVFFTILTGFTFLTGYVPEGGNILQFSSWGAYDENNMKVTDCGCFGDFIKLKPKTSFFKDIFLLIPSIYFVLAYKKMHSLFTKRVNGILISLSTLTLILYCLSNYSWDIPHADFRPFKIDADIRGQKEIEMNAAANVQITAWKLRNLTNPGQVVELSNDVYMKQWADYPKTEWEVLEQIKTKPEIEKTKISDFEISDLDGYDVADDLLSIEEYSFWIVCHKLKGKTKLDKVSFQDSLFSLDTMVVFDPTTYEETFTVKRELDTVINRTEDVYLMEWNEQYVNKFEEFINPLVDQAKDKGIGSHVFIGKFGKDEILDFKEKSGLEAKYYMADDILLKTIVRSNPGVVLVKDGKIIHKWHLKKLPDFEEIYDNYISK